MSNGKYTLNKWDNPDKIIDNTTNETYDLEQACELLNTKESTIKHLLEHKNVQSSTDWELKYWDEVQDKMALEEQLNIIHEIITGQIEKYEKQLKKNVLKQPQLQHTQMQKRQLTDLYNQIKEETRGLSPITSYRIGEDYWLLTIENLLETFKPALTKDDLTKLKAEIISTIIKNKLIYGKTGMI